MIDGARKVMEREEREVLYRLLDDAALAVLVLGVFAVNIVSCLLK